MQCCTSIQAKFQAHPKVFGRHQLSCNWEAVTGIEGLYPHLLRLPDWCSLPLDPYPNVTCSMYIAHCIFYIMNDTDTMYPDMLRLSHWCSHSPDPTQMYHILSIHCDTAKTFLLSLQKISRACLAEERNRKGTESDLQKM